MVSKQINPKDLRMEMLEEEITTLRKTNLIISKRLTMALYTVDELTKENAELKDWNAKLEDRLNNENQQLEYCKSALDQEIEQYILKEATGGE